MYKVFIYEYQKVLKNIAIFKDNDSLVLFMIGKIDVNFYYPEQEIMKSYDKNFKRVFYTGEGVCNVYQYFDSSNRLCLGSLKKGTIVGEI